MKPPNPITIFIYTITFLLSVSWNLQAQTDSTKKYLSIGYGPWELVFPPPDKNDEGDKDGEGYTTEFNYVTHQPAVFCLKYEAANKKGRITTHNFAFSTREITNDFTFDTRDTVYHASRTRIAFSYIWKRNEYLIENEKFQLYWGAGLGIRLTFYINYEDNFYGKEDDDIQHLFVPLAAEVTMGCRYFFTKKLALYSEAGIAKAPFQIGLSARW